MENLTWWCWKKKKKKLYTLPLFHSLGRALLVYKGLFNTDAFLSHINTACSTEYQTILGFLPSHKPILAPVAVQSLVSSRLFIGHGILLCVGWRLQYTDITALLFTVIIDQNIFHIFIPSQPCPPILYCIVWLTLRSITVILIKSQREWMELPLTIVTVAVEDVIITAVGVNDYAAVQAWMKPTCRAHHIPLLSASKQALAICWLNELCIDVCHWMTCLNDDGVNVVPHISYLICGKLNACHIGPGPGKRPPNVMEHCT